jgi:hypothetical protein
LGGLVRLRDLAFFTACGRLGNSGCLGTPSGFDALCCGGAGGLLGLTQSTTHGGVSVFCLMGTDGLLRMTRSGLRCCGGGLGLSLGQQRLFADLLGSTMPQLRAILPARSREVTILCSVKIRPGVKDRHIFGGLRYCRLIDPVGAARIHISSPITSGYRGGFS